MEDVIRIQDQFYILATSSRADDRTQVLKHGETFAVFDHHGDVLPFGLGEQGLYHRGTRFLSRCDLRVGAARPLLLSSTVRDDNDVLTVDLTNPDISLQGDVLLPRGTLHILRSKFLWEGTCFESLRVSNHGRVPVDISLTFLFQADFADIFEVRGIKRKERGRRLEDSVEGPVVRLGYQGLDGVLREARLCWSPQPQEISTSSARFELHLLPRASASCFLTLRCEEDGNSSQLLTYDQAYTLAAEEVLRAKAKLHKIRTSSGQFNEWLSRSVADTHMMVAQTDRGPYPHAGVPWFSTVFGRDGIITALEVLWIDPSLARGVLSYLAANQASRLVPEEDAEPGKILHEVRYGEMAALKEVPFGRYYGSVDATPLFVILAAAYYQRTADLGFIESIWDNVERALAWMEFHGDLDGDGFVEYQRKSGQGLLHQGWKDSHDAVFHQDGELAEGPIALCEVQAYVYAARRRAAELAMVLGKSQRALELGRQAMALRDRFEATFWCEDLSTYALALDGRKRPCRVRTSNAGHCLFAGISSPERARQVGQTLLLEESFSGWGVRTVAATEARYNPMSYHNGSVWPHDNALIALGFSRYGLREELRRTLEALFDASTAFDLHRMPELFCGFPRRRGQGPTRYPVACSPQSWAAGAVFMFLEASLGITIHGASREIRFVRPRLPDFLKTLRIEGLPVGEGSVDLFLKRWGRDVEVQVLSKDDEISVMVTK